MKHILIYLLIFCHLCNGMQKENYSEIQKVENQILKKFTQATISSIEYYRPTVKITLINNNDSSRRFSANFIFKNSKDKTVYLTPLLENLDEGLNVLILNYWLLLLAKNGHTEQACEMLKKGANPRAPDKHLLRPQFNISTREGTICTLKDIIKGNFSRLIKSDRPVIAIHPYSNTYNFTAIDYALRQCNIGVLEKIKKVSENNPSDDLLKTMQHLNINKLRSDLDKEQQELQEAQRLEAIPTFPIMPHSNTITSKYGIASNKDSALSILTLTDKDTCIIEEKTDRSTWKHHYLDIDALATLYARLITVNETEGKKIIDLFDKWKTYDFFTAHVIRYVIDNLEKESYEDQPLLLENLFSFAQRIAHHKNIIQETLHAFQTERLLGTLLCLCASKAYDESGKLLKPQWKKAGDTFIKSLMKQDDTKQFCREICNYNTPLFFVPIIKVSMQKALLQLYCEKILSKIEPHLGDTIIEHIVSYWEPDEKFIQKIKIYEIKQGN